MTAEVFLSRLDRVRQTGSENASPSIRETDDGRVLLRCWAGCGALEVLSVAGLDWSAVMPERVDMVDREAGQDRRRYRSGGRRSFLPTDVFDIARTETSKRRITRMTPATLRASSPIFRCKPGRTGRPGSSGSVGREYV